MFHGHAHNGTPDGTLANGTPCYNVAMPLLRKHYPDQVPVKFIEVDPDSPTAGDDGAAYDGMERRRAGEKLTLHTA